MANTQAIDSVTLPVATATVLEQYQLVQINSSGQLDDPSAAGDRVVGVALAASSATSDAAVPVALMKGVIKVLCGGNINAGAFVQTNTSGEAVAGDQATGFGQALEAGADGRVISVIVASPAS